MHLIITIFRKEIQSLIGSFTGYLFLALFVSITGYFTWFSDMNIFIENQARLSNFFTVASWALFFLIPVLSMRSIADEKRQGTMTLLLTKPISPRQIITGKFLAYSSFLLLALLCTLPYVITVLFYGSPDLGAMLGGYLSLLFVGVCFIGISLLAGALTKNAIIALLISLAINFLFFFPSFTQNHVYAFIRGVYYVSAVLFFISILWLCLESAIIALDTNNRTTSCISRFIIFILLIGGLNYSFMQVSLKIDATADKRYTLSNATKKILADIQQPIDVQFFFTDKIHPNFDRVGKEFIQLLSEYEYAFPQNFSYSIIYTNSDEDNQRAIDAGLSPLLVNVKEKDKSNVQKAFLGAIIKVGERSALIPMIKPGVEMEYALTSAIKKTTINNSAKIAFLTGHNETSIDLLRDVATGLSMQYTTDVFSIDDTAPIPLNYKAVVIVDPRDTFPPVHLYKLSKYLEQGGNLFIAMSRTESNLTDLFIDPISTNGIEAWLRTRGIYIASDNVVDMNCATVLVQQQEGDASYNTDLPFHYYPLFTNFAQHTITSGLEKVLMTCPSSISIVNPLDGYIYEPLVFSSEQSGRIKPPQQIDVARQWTPQDFIEAKIPVAFAVKPITKAAGSKMVVIANGTFVTNGHNGMQELYQDNISLALNSIDWLLDDIGLVEIRTKAIQSFPMQKLTDEERTRIKYANAGVPFLLIVCMMLLQFLHVRQKKKQWNQMV